MSQFLSKSCILSLGLRITVLAVFLGAATVSGFSQTVSDSPSVVQPGSPGQPTRQISAETRPSLPVKSPKDVEFMQGMIHHHAQAVEMTALIDERTVNKEIRLLGSRISASQAAEIAFMTRWLALRGERSEIKGSEHSSGHSHGVHNSSSVEPMMPGMLSTKQMVELKMAKGAQFDRLFLEGMIQHHQGALVMVKDLFKNPGTGQDAELFSFTTDVDAGQLAEIKIMQTLLGRTP